MSSSKIAPIYFALLLLGLAITAVVLIYTRPQKAPELKSLAPLRVEAVEVRRANVRPYDRITGRLLPARTSMLHFEVEGNLVERHVEPGQAVQPGELLLRLADSDYRDTLIEAEARLAQEEAGLARDRTLLELAIKNVQLAQTEVARLERLGQESLASQSIRDEANQRLLQLQSEQAHLDYSVTTGRERLTVLRAARDRARRNLERTRLSAPYAGRVNRVLAQVGDHLTPSVEVLALIDDQTLDLYAEVNAATAAALWPGQEIEVAVADRQLSGRLVALQLDPDPSTFTHPLKIRLTGPGLLPGQIATARLPLAPALDALVVPLSALLRDNGQHYVFVIQDRRLERRRVEPGIRFDNLQVIRSGLNAEERVVARDVNALSDGLAVDLAVAETASAR